MNLRPLGVGIYRAVGIKHAAFGNGHQAIIDQLSILNLTASQPADVEESGIDDFILNSSVEIALTYGEDSWQSYFWDFFAGGATDTAREIKSGEYKHAAVAAAQTIFKPLKIVAKIKKRLDRPGEFTRAQRRAAKRQNADARNGQMACTDCDKPVENIPSKKGVPTPDNQAQVHHDPPIAEGGGRHSKPVVLCPPCHRRRHDGET